MSLMYLPHNDWSARYDSTFYSVKVEEKHLITSADELSPLPSQIGGREQLPAFYYTVNIYREHMKSSILRRYSHFYWLYQEIEANPPMVDTPVGSHVEDNTPIRMPPGTCLWIPQQNEDFAQKRMEQLDEFLDGILRRPGYSNHPAVKTFLELE